MMKFLILSALLSTSALSHAQLEDANALIGARYANGIAAIAEDKIITADDIRREIQPLIPQFQEQSKQDPQTFRQLIEEAENQIIQTLTDNVLIVKQFKKDKGMIPPSIIKNEVEENIINQFDGDRSKFLAYLKSIGKTPEEYETTIREDIIVNYMRGKLRKSEAFVSPVRIERFYIENKDQFYEEEGLHLRLIKLSRLTDESGDLLEQTANEIVRKLDEGTDFGTLAKKHSQDAKKSKGGDWGWITKKSLVPELAEHAFKLKKGEYTKPVKFKDSVFIMYAEDYRPAGHVPIEEVRQDIEYMLISQMTNEAQDKWLERLRRDGYVRRFH